jgi:branched-chain amino acid transport system permease protein
MHFGHNAFIGIGAYTSALMVMRVGLSFWLGMLLAGLVGVIFAVLVGYPALRVKWVYFSIITWGFGEVLRFLYMRLKEPFGGVMGVYGIPKPSDIVISSLGLKIEFSSKIPWFLLALCLMLVTLFVLYRLERSRFGLIFNAISEGDLLAKSVGINIMRYKVLAFAIACFFASVGGSFYAHYTTIIAPQDFAVILTIYLGSYVLVGGMNRFSGSIVGTALLVTAGQLFVVYGFYRTMIYAALMIVIILFFPEGLVGLPALTLSALGKFRKWFTGGRYGNA